MWSAVWALWREMRSRGGNPTAITVDCTVNALVKTGEVVEARKLVQDLVYLTILKGSVLSKQPQRVFAVHSKMRVSGTQCNTITYNTMIDACARCGMMVKDPRCWRRGRLAVWSPTSSPTRRSSRLSPLGRCRSGLEVLQELMGDGEYTLDVIMYTRSWTGVRCRISCRAPFGCWMT